MITVAELSVGAYKSPRKDALEKTLKLLSVVNIVDLSMEIAVEGGRIFAELMKKGEEIELNDCLIAATSLSLGIQEIVTRNIDHFVPKSWIFKGKHDTKISTIKVYR